MPMRKEKPSSKMALRMELWGTEAKFSHDQKGNNVWG